LIATGYCASGDDCCVPTVPDGSREPPPAWSGPRRCDSDANDGPAGRRWGPLTSGYFPRQSRPVIVSVKPRVAKSSTPAMVTVPLIPRRSPVPVMLVEVARKAPVATSNVPATCAVSVAKWAGEDDRAGERRRCPDHLIDREGGVRAADHESVARDRGLCFAFPEVLTDTRRADREADRAGARRRALRCADRQRDSNSQDREQGASAEQGHGSLHRRAPRTSARRLYFRGDGASERPA
jgi:hypothetical protein